MSTGVILKEVFIMGVSNLIVKKNCSSCQRRGSLSIGVLGPCWCSITAIGGTRWGICCPCRKIEGVWGVPSASDLGGEGRDLFLYFEGLRCFIFCSFVVEKQSHPSEALVSLRS
jgi:hypothetical protein